MCCSLGTGACLAPVPGPAATLCLPWDVMAGARADPTPAPGSAGSPGLLCPFLTSTKTPRREDPCGAEERCHNTEWLCGKCLMTVSHSPRSQHAPDLAGKHEHWGAGLRGSRLLYTIALAGILEAGTWGPADQTPHGPAWTKATQLSSARARAQAWAAGPPASAPHGPRVPVSSLLTPGEARSLQPPRAVLADLLKTPLHCARWALCREVRSPCAWRGGARPGSRVTGSHFSRVRLCATP